MTKHATSASVHKAYIYIYVTYTYVHTYVYTCNLLIIREEARLGGRGGVPPRDRSFNRGSLLFQRPWEVLRISGSGLHLLASRWQRNALLQQPAAAQVRWVHIFHISPTAFRIFSLSLSLSLSLSEISWSRCVLHLVRRHSVACFSANNFKERHVQDDF